MGIALAVRICIIVIGTLPKIMRFGRVRRVGDVPSIAYFYTAKGVRHDIRRILKREL